MHPQITQSVFKLRRRLAVAAVLDPVDLVELVVFLVPRSSVDQNETGVVLDEQTPHAELDAIALIGRNAALPQRFWNNTEHRTAVEPLPACLNGVYAPTTNDTTLHQ